MPLIIKRFNSGRPRLPARHINWQQALHNTLFRLAQIASAQPASKKKPRISPFALRQPIRPRRLVNRIVAP